MSVEQDKEAQLPKGWAWVSIGETGEYINGFAFKPSHREPTGLPIVRIQNLTDETKPLNTTTLDVPLDYKVDNGDMLVSWSATLDVFVWRRGPALVNQHIFKVVPEERVVSKELLFYWLKRAIQQLQETEHLHGSTMMHINRGPFMAHLVPLPPVAEQTRIVAKLEELLSDLDAGVAELRAAQKKLVQYRQSLLKAAVEGTLTAEWREARRKRHSTPLSPRGRGVGGEGVQALNTSDETWFRDRARQLRQEQTPMEQLLWQQLRARRFSGFKFRRQQKIGRYIVDFVCFAQKLIIELDGSQHADAQVEDATRDHWLRGEGFRVLRFWNNELLGQTDAVLEAIWQALQQEPPLPNPSPTRGEGLESETGTQLLERILQERRARWEAKQLAKFQEQGKTPPKDWQKKYPEPVQPDTTDLPELPEEWVWATLSQVGWLDRGRSKHRPRNAPHLYGGPYPFVQTGDIRHADTFLSDVEASYSKAGLAQSRLWPAGTMCITIAANIGKTAILSMEACFPDSVVGFLSGSDDVSIRYVEYFMRSVQQKLEDEAPATAQKNINLEILEKVVIPLPPALEQHQIVKLLDDSMDAARESDRAIDLSLKQSTAQRQNLLRAAFAGELVQQDPNDEPASRLLERIRAERAALAASKKTRSRKTKETSS